MHAQYRASKPAVNKRRLTRSRPPCEGVFFLGGGACIENLLWPMTYVSACDVDGLTAHVLALDGARLLPVLHRRPEHMIDTHECYGGCLWVVVEICHGLIWTRLG